MVLAPPAMSPPMQFASKSSIAAGGMTFRPMTRSRNPGANRSICCSMRPVMSIGRPVRHVAVRPGGVLPLGCARGVEQTRLHAEHEGPVRVSSDPDLTLGPGDLPHGASHMDCGGPGHSGAFQGMGPLSAQSTLEKYRRVRTWTGFLGTKGAACRRLSAGPGRAKGRRTLPRRVRCRSVSPTSCEVTTSAAQRLEVRDQRGGDAPGTSPGDGPPRAMAGHGHHQGEGRAQGVRERKDRVGAEPGQHRLAPGGVEERPAEQRHGQDVLSPRAARRTGCRGNARGKADHRSDPPIFP